MAGKKLAALIGKTVKKVIRKEIGKLKKDNLSIISNLTNNTLDSLVANVDTWKDKDTTEEIIDDIYASGYVSLHPQENAELEHKLRELKFKQELRKDWILFIVKDVIVYSATVIFIFLVAGFYIFTLINTD